MAKKTEVKKKNSSDEKPTVVKKIERVAKVVENKSPDGDKAAEHMSGLIDNLPAGAMETGKKKHEALKRIRLCLINIMNYPLNPPDTAKATAREALDEYDKL